MGERHSFCVLALTLSSLKLMFSYKITFTKLLTLWAIPSALLFQSCSNSEDVLIQKNDQINHLVYLSESECDTFKAKVDIEIPVIIYPNLGLSYQYFPQALSVSNTYYGVIPNEEKIYTNSFRSKLQKLPLNSVERIEVNKLIASFDEKQNPICLTAYQILQDLNDSLARFISIENSKKQQNIITKSDYDQIITVASETFLRNLRHINIEHKLEIQSAKNYRQLLNSLSEILSKRHWEMFVSHYGGK